MRLKTLFFVLIFSVFSFSPTYIQAETVSKEKNHGLNIALQQVGSGNKFNEDGSNWCADFVVFVYKEKLPVEPSRSARALWNNFRKAGLTTENPKPGDIIFFWRESPNSWKGHTGLVKEITGTHIVTVEGNVKGKVTIRTYKLGEIPKLLGFGKIT